MVTRVNGQERQRGHSKDMVFPIPDLIAFISASVTLEAGESTVVLVRFDPSFAAHLSPHNRLSQLNVLQQLDHLLSYPAVAARVEAGTLGLNAWWFDLAAAEVLAFEPARGRFEPIGATPEELAAYDEQR